MVARGSAMMPIAAGRGLGGSTLVNSALSFRPAREVLDGWAAVMDVLSFYQERLAAESYLDTCTERRSLLELGRQVGYELRPALEAPSGLAPVWRHGIFRERHAEFATDALRALLLEWAGYATQVAEFTGAEHTAKNLLLSGLRQRRLGDAGKAAAVREFAAAYGIRTQALARHMGFDLVANPASPR
jgi:choline dehydrogenase-like flavoprotein